MLRIWMDKLRYVWAWCCPTSYLQRRSKSVGIILTKFLKPAPCSAFRSAKTSFPHLIPSFRKCLVYRFLCSPLSFDTSAGCIQRKFILTTCCFEQGDPRDMWTRNGVYWRSANIVCKMCTDSEGAYKPVGCLLIILASSIHRECLLSCECIVYDAIIRW
jgi:hypothetical protein